MRNKPSFDWNDLRYLLAIAREGSTLAAARALHVNQSTVQRRLSELEQRLGCAVAERHPAGYRLTDEGRRLLPFAERVEDDVHALQRHAATFDARMIGSVRVTCLTAVAYRLMKSALLDDFHKLYPGITVTLLMTEHTLDLSKGEAEVAIRGGADTARYPLPHKTLSDCGSARCRTQRAQKPTQSTVSMCKTKHSRRLFVTRCLDRPVGSTSSSRRAGSSASWAARMMNGADMYFDGRRPIALAPVLSMVSRE